MSANRHLITAIDYILTLTLAGFAIAAEAESRAAAAGATLVAVAQQADVGATSSLPKLIQGTCMATHWVHKSTTYEVKARASE